MSQETKFKVGVAVANITRLEIPIYRYTVVRFASIAEGRKLLGTLDDYVKALTPLDMKLRMKTNQKVSGELSDYLIFKLMAVEIVNGVCQPALDRGTPILYDVSEVTNFYEQVGHNTEYIIHPEEILACNFVYMVKQKPDVPSPEMLDSLKEILSK